MFTADREEISCDAKNLVATGNVRKNDRGYWLVAIRRGGDVVEVPANALGPPNSVESDLKGKVFSVADVKFMDWLRLRVAPAPFAEYVSGIPRLQDNLRATGRVATWKRSRWIDIEYIANLGWVRVNIRDASPQELIYSDTRTIIGWVNARYLKETEDAMPPDVASGFFWQR